VNLLPDITGSNPQNFTVKITTPLWPTVRKSYLKLP